MIEDEKNKPQTIVWETPLFRITEKDDTLMAKRINWNYDLRVERQQKMMKDYLLRQPQAEKKKKQSYAKFSSDREFEAVQFKQATR